MPEMSSFIGANGRFGNAFPPPKRTSLSQFSVARVRSELVFGRHVFTLKGSYVAVELLLE